MEKNKESYICVCRKIKTKLVAEFIYITGALFINSVNMIKHLLCVRENCLIGAPKQ